MKPEMKLHFSNFSNCSLCLDKKTLSIIYDTMNVIYNLPKTKSESVADWITKSNIGSRIGTPVAHPIFNLFWPNDAPFHWCTLRKSSKNRRIDRWKNSSLLSSHEIPRDWKSNRNTSFSVANFPNSVTKKLRFCQTNRRYWYSKIKIMKNL